ncbi:MAG: transposase [Verrucomicrobia bacterium]|nr:transposase [Verrucomicrobiota bacterium]MBU1910353.1 transposase [Verrucomicrobiota bacterium]
MKTMKWLRGLAILCLLTGVTERGLAQQGEAGMADFMKAMQAMTAAASNSAPVVDFRELKSLLPEALDGFKRTNASGEKNTVMGMTVSQAEGRYEQGDGYIEINITDNGGLGGLMGFGQAAWAPSEIDRESDTGFERTTIYGSHKAREEYDNADQRGEIEILVGGRFMVKTSGYGIPFAALQSAAKKVDLDKLVSLKPATP